MGSLADDELEFYCYVMSSLITAVSVVVWLLRKHDLRSGKTLKSGNFEIQRLYS